jgi:hypothetical protein
VINPEVRPDTLEDGWNAVAAGSAAAPDEELLRAWARSLVGMAVAKLEAECQARGQQQHFELFVRRYVQDPDNPPTWRQVGDAFGLEEKIARSRADTAVRRFRIILRHLIASDVGAEEGVDEELHALMAVL